jgi:hypothetical protein
MTGREVNVKLNSFQVTELLSREVYQFDVRFEPMCIPS